MELVDILRILAIISATATLIIVMKDPILEKFKKQP